MGLWRILSIGEVKPCSRKKVSKDVFFISTYPFTILRIEEFIRVSCQGILIILRSPNLTKRGSSMKKVGRNQHIKKQNKNTMHEKTYAQSCSRPMIVKNFHFHVLNHKLLAQLVRAAMLIMQRSQVWHLHGLFYIFLFHIFVWISVISPLFSVQSGS